MTKMFLNTGNLDLSICKQLRVFNFQGVEYAFDTYFIHVGHSSLMLH